MIVLEYSPHITLANAHTVHQTMHAVTHNSEHDNKDKVDRLNIYQSEAFRIDVCFACSLLSDIQYGLSVIHSFELHVPVEHLNF